MKPRSKIIATVLKLRELANSTQFPAERDLARKRAAALMRKYKISGVELKAAAAAAARAAQPKMAPASPNKARFNIGSFTLEWSDDSIEINGKRYEAHQVEQALSEQAGSWMKDLVLGILQGGKPKRS